MARRGILPCTICVVLLLVAAVFIIVATAVMAPVGTARAQTSAPQFLITWKIARSYVPSSYLDKAMPTYGSVITASVALLAQGKLVNLNSQTIYWYQNGVLIGGGTGVQTVSFLPLDEPPTINTLEVDIPNYNGSYLIHTVPIQTTQPVAVIEAPYPGGQTSANPVTVTALPYFFNTASPANLSYAWTVNGQAGANAENPQTAEITLPAGTPAGTALSVTLAVNNPQDSTAASANVSLTYSPSQL